MNRQHYHVLGGLHGCMPSINYTCKTLGEAREILKDEKEKEIDIWYQVEHKPRVRIEGQVRNGYLEITNGTIDYLEITTCQEPDCLIDLDS